MTQHTDADIRKCLEKVYTIADECLDGWRELDEGMTEIKNLLEEYADILLD